MDWGEASVIFDEIASEVADRELASESESQTRFQVIDRLILEVLDWKRPLITVEERTTELDVAYIDYVLRSGDFVVLVEVKKIGAAFPTPTSRSRLSLSGSVLSQKEISDAVKQAEGYSRSLDCDVIVVTNGRCWCSFTPQARSTGELALLHFPFEKPEQAEQLWNFLAEKNVASGSLSKLSQVPPLTENRLIYELSRIDGRVDRNNIADHIVPALNRALYADAILSDVDQLTRCFVPTEARSRFDSLLEMHLSDIKPEEIKPARRIRTSKEKGEVYQIVESGVPEYAPPVTLIIGPVGAGKSTYLSHFQHVAGRRLLEEVHAHWIYVDFEEMGPSGRPREFLYSKLRSYLAEEHSGVRTDFHALAEPAYSKEIAGLAKGPLSPIFKNKQLFDQKVSEFIQKDYDQVEPYVDKVYKYLAEQHLTVIVVDNIDLYEDEELETAVFAEGLAFSKRVKAHVIVSLRDTTFVKHKSDSVFDAYELRKLWIDPPPYREVLSRRLSFSQSILDGRSARIPTSGGSQIVVENLAVFFDIVRESVLSGETGDFLDAVSDSNIRRGLSLVSNFLTSGHIQADRALKVYLDPTGKGFRFPFQEVFKGTMLGQWRHFREDRSECINLFDSRLGSSSLRLLRLHVLQFMYLRARQKETLETRIAEIGQAISPAGASHEAIVKCIQNLRSAGLLRAIYSDGPTDDHIMVITRSGGYYAKLLCKRFVYVEECMHDTAIDRSDYWDQLCDLTDAVEYEHDIPRRMEVRKRRILTFLEYLEDAESRWLSRVPGLDGLRTIPAIVEAVNQETDVAVIRARRWYNDEEQAKAAT
jgi:hypothetical protein